ncbi:MAG: anti-sigma F factor [Christensenellales bacterium]
MNYFKMQILGISENEKFCRSAIAAFCVGLAPNVEEINDVKTAVSEAVTNVIVHAYDGEGEVGIEAYIEENKLTVVISDTGKGISDVIKAQEPFYSTKSEDERSGMGFTVMQTFMDSLNVESEIGKGTKVTMTKVFGGKC